MTAALVVWLAAAERLSPCPEYREALALAGALREAFDDAGAAAAYEDALALDPEAVEARLGLTEVLNALGEAAPAPEAEPLFERALRFAEAVQALRPAEPEPHYWVAASCGNLIALRDGPEKVRLARRIEAAARRALAVDPCFAPAYAVLGITYRELSSLNWFVRGIAAGLFGGLPKGSLADAERLLGTAVALDPGDPFAGYELALTLERRRRP
ncbi:MAG TPA: hypothetical protein VLI67_11395, partial [Vicinamibacteria bacterium]|nr:hypothetical protein [Vicinamibacteria bacterium]